MDDGLKQRLIGAMVLFALAVIFVPVLFDRERIEPVDRTTQIPVMPSFAPIPLETPPPAKTSEPVLEVREEPSELVQIETVTPTPKPSKVPSQAFIPDPKTAKENDKPVSVLDENGVPNSWVLQVASFRDNARAVSLRDKLIADGHSAYNREVNTSRGKMVRVYLGPKLDRDALLSLQPEVDAQYKVKTLLLRFKP